MWGKIIIPMYRSWLNGLYGLYGPRCPLFSKRPRNLISLSLSHLAVVFAQSIEARCSEFSREWRCSWSNADRRCSNYIWVINNFIANWGVTYIRDLMVLYKSTIWFSGDGSVWSCFAACVPRDLICNVPIVSGVIRSVSTNQLLMGCYNMFGILPNCGFISNVRQSEPTGVWVHPMISWSWPITYSVLL